MNEIFWHEGLTPTSYGSGPFHPAIRNGRNLWYWPNITFPDEDSAYQRAVEALASVLHSAGQEMAGWNMWKIDRR